MATWIKQGVYGVMRPEIDVAKRKLERLYSSEGKDLYITSIMEGTHSPGSLHHAGFAFDIRSEGVSIDRIRSLLGDDYDVVVEKTHLHIEYDPK